MATEVKVKILSWVARQLTTAPATRLKPKRQPEATITQQALDRLSLGHALATARHAPAAPAASQPQARVRSSARTSPFTVISSYSLRSMSKFRSSPTWSPMMTEVRG